MKRILLIMLVSAIMSANCTNSSDEDEEDKGKDPGGLQKKMEQLGLEDKGKTNNPSDQEEPQGAAGGTPQGAEGPHPKGAEGYTPSDPQTTPGDPTDGQKDWSVKDVIVDTNDGEKAANSLFKTVTKQKGKVCHLFSPQSGFIYKTVLYKGEKVWEGADGVRCILIQYCKIKGKNKIIYLDLSDGTQVAMKKKGNKWKTTKPTSDESEEPEASMSMWKKWKLKNQTSDDSDDSEGSESIWKRWRKK